LRIETVVAPGKGDFHITGQLGEIMQESITAAWGYLKTAIARDDRLGVLWDISPGKAYLLDHYTPPEPAVGDAGPGEMGVVVEAGPPAMSEAPDGESGGPTDHDLLSALEVRIHLPEGAVPKEGPSAGIAVAASILSALFQWPLKPRVALSGEITLTGQVLAVGGLKEKLLAALREGVRTVILPEDVRPQVKELPKDLTRDFEIVYVTEFPDVLEHVLASAPDEGAGPAAGIGPTAGPSPTIES
jgi:ATP-dependent Lon protease